MSTPTKLFLCQKSSSLSTPVSQKHSRATPVSSWCLKAAVSTGVGPQAEEDILEGHYQVPPNKNTLMNTKTTCLHATLPLWQRSVTLVLWHSSEANAKNWEGSPRMSAHTTDKDLGSFWPGPPAYGLDPRDSLTVVLVTSLSPHPTLHIGLSLSESLLR